ncbi:MULTISPECIES: MFS transporter [Streptomyces]|uniref:MFS transporter n=1 Tax=Streptomyces TaxID=1883 RepID=UPI00093D67FE|nr:MULTISPECIES: MFS transporter [unclassified Streptomyces]OKJ07249.1 MFS transporter permease [Streptomyces sp. TSRI0261]QNQ37750.1 MFS transporter [Streptomyces sp. CB00271]
MRPPSSTRPSPAPSLWRDTDFRRLWAGQTASQLGEHTALVVLPLFAVLTLDAGAGQLGALRAVEQAPILLLSLLAGAWVDRRRARTVMVLTDAARAVALGAAAVAGLLGLLGLPALFVVAFTVGALSVLFDVAYQASLVRMVRRDQLVRGNSALEGSRSAAQIGGPALGGALVSLLSAPVAAAAGALFFAVSCVSLRRIRCPESVPEHVAPVPERPEHAAPVPERPEHTAPLRGRIREGLRFVAGNAWLRAVCLASAAFQFSFAATMTVYLLFLPRELHLTGAAVGLALAATGPGALLGSVLAARLPGRLGHGVVLVSAAVLGNGALLCVPALRGSSTTTVLALLAVNFVFGTFSQLVNVTVMSVRQAVTPDGMQGRAAATITFVGMGFTPLGSLLGGLLAQEWGLRTGLLVAAAGMMLSPVLMAASPLARLGRVLPVPGEEPRPTE